MNNEQHHVVMKLSSGRFLCLLAALIVFVVASIWELRVKNELPAWAHTLCGMIIGWYIRQGFNNGEKTGVVVLLLASSLLLCGCVGPIVYAPQAKELTIYKHQQDAEFMGIQQDIQPRVADKFVEAIGAQIEGNSVLSPKVENVGNPEIKAP